jgi:hypothetical protein
LLSKELAELLWLEPHEIVEQGTATIEETFRP